MVKIDVILVILASRRTNNFLNFVNIRLFRVYIGSYSYLHFVLIGSHVSIHLI